MKARGYTLRLSIFFFLLFTPFSSFMSILTHIYEQAHLAQIGPATLASNYVAFITSTLLAPTLSISLKKQLLMGGVAYTLNYASGIFVPLVDHSWAKFLITCGASFVAGLSAGPLWVSQGRYIHIACVKSNELYKKGQMYGLFTLLYCFSNVTAGFITTFGLGFFDEKVYFYVITGLGIVAMLYCLFFVPELEQVDHPTDARDSIIVAAESVEDSLLEETTQQSSLKPQAPKTSLKDVIKFFPVMWMVLPILLVDGVSLGIYSSEIPKLVPTTVSKDMVNRYAGYLLISLGAGATLGGFVLSWISDRVSSYFTGRLSIILFVLGCGLFVGAYQMNQFIPALVASFEWGFFLFFLQGWMYLVCSRHFEGKAEAFSVNKLLHSLFYLLFQIVLIPTHNHLPLFWLVSIFAVLAIPSFFLIGRIPPAQNPAYRQTEKLT